MKVCESERERDKERERRRGRERKIIRKRQSEKDKKRKIDIEDCRKKTQEFVREIKRERERGSEGKNEWGLDCLFLLFTLIIGGCSGVAHKDKADIYVQQERER